MTYVVTSIGNELLYQLLQFGPSPCTNIQYRVYKKKQQFVHLTKILYVATKKLSMLLL